MHKQKLLFCKVTDKHIQSNFKTILPDLLTFPSSYALPCTTSTKMNVAMNKEKSDLVLVNISEIQCNLTFI